MLLYEKDLLDIISIFSVPVVALIAVYIAFQQWKINERRLKHEQFDRNFKVYDAILNFIGSVITTGRADDGEVSKFLVETKPAKFLLGEDIKNFIDEIYNKAIDLQTYESQLDGLPASEEKTILINQRADTKKWIYRQFSELDKKFKDYLSL